MSLSLWFLPALNLCLLCSSFCFASCLCTPPTCLCHTQAISDRTMMMPQDIMETLKQLNLLSYWKGQHFIAAPAKVVEDYWKMYNAGGEAVEVA